MQRATRVHSPRVQWLFSFFSNESRWTTPPILVGTIVNCSHDCYCCTCMELCWIAKCAHVYPGMATFAILFYSQLLCMACTNIIYTDTNLKETTHIFRPETSVWTWFLGNSIMAYHTIRKVFVTPLSVAYIITIIMILG